METIQNYNLGYVPGKCYNLNKVQVRDAEISVGEGNTRSLSFPARQSQSWLVGAVQGGWRC